MEDEMRFLDYISPSLPEGKYKIVAEQDVTVGQQEGAVSGQDAVASEKDMTEPKQSKFSQQKEFCVAGYAYTLQSENVFSVFPAENESGEFADLLPHLVLNKRSFPWERKVCEAREGTPVPWVALIVVADGEGAIERDIQISELETAADGVFFPKNALEPDTVCEKATDSCHVVELPLGLYQKIIPSAEDLPYLCHARSVNLEKTEDDICAMDGFFSVVCANRFVPSGTEDLVKSTVHLVSMAGYINPALPQDCKTVRMVSLYHWDIFSKRQSEEDFAAIMERLKVNCGVMGTHMPTELQKEGYCAKRHITRTGEETYSLYRSPLIPFENKEQLDMSDRHTADGRLIYDKVTGLMDVTYAAAWQLGRILTLNHNATASEILRCRRLQKQRKHEGLLRDNLDFEELGLEELTMKLAREKLLDKQSEKADTRKGDRIDEADEDGAQAKAPT